MRRVGCNIVREGRLDPPESRILDGNGLSSEKLDILQQAQHSVAPSGAYITQGDNLGNDEGEL